MNGDAEIVGLDAVSLSRLITARGVSCREVMRAYLAQIDRLTPKVHASVTRQDRTDPPKEADEPAAHLTRGARKGRRAGSRTRA